MSDNEMDFLFIHPVGKNNPVYLLPLGWTALADYLQQHDIKHLGFAIHWHNQSYTAVKTIRRIKKSFPHITITVGGFTASFFAEQIMKEHREIDFIIKGDSEVPLVNLLDTLLAGKNDFSQLSNLVWRKDGVL